MPLNPWLVRLAVASLVCAALLFLWLLVFRLSFALAFFLGFVLCFGRYGTRAVAIGLLLVVLVVWIVGRRTPKPAYDVKRIGTVERYRAVLTPASDDCLAFDVKEVAYISKEDLPDKPAFGDD